MRGRPRPGRVRRFVGRVFGDAQRNAKEILTPLPEEEVQPVPPVIASSESRLLKYSPFSLGFFGALGVFVAIVLATAIQQVQSVLILVVLALVLALGLSPAVDFFTRRRVPRAAAVFIVTTTTLGIIVLGVTALVPIITEQAQALSSNLPGLLNNLTSHSQIAQWNDDFHIIDRINEFVLSGDLIQTLFGGIWGAGRVVANLVFSTIVTLVLTIYFLASLPAIKEAIYKLAPGSRRERARYLAGEIFRGVSGYITGMFMIVSVASVCSFIFMNIAGLGSYSLALAFIVALFCFIPVVGSSLAMIAVAIVGFAVNPPIGVAPISYFLISQQIDASVLSPHVMRR
ncbi:MAG: AI-2E family transporter, partial [Arachnia sp.]